ncbi:MAG: hypothetical protein Q7S55_04565 [Nanoarchaeota archaeon]|nr:hypothetical protein [Nanoarchaeota archaeon]
MVNPVKNPKFRSRKGYKLVMMSNNQTIWLREDSRQIAEKILNHLENDLQKIGKPRKVTFSQLSEETGIRKASVSSACYLLAFRKEPLIRMWADRVIKKNISSPNTVRTYMRIRILKKATSIGRVTPTKKIPALTLTKEKLSKRLLYNGEKSG